VSYTCQLQGVRVITLKTLDPFGEIGNPLVALLESPPQPTIGGDGILRKGSESPHAVHAAFHYPVLLSESAIGHRIRIQI
jgi:hypothetical protein